MPELYSVVTDGCPGLAAAPVSPPISISIGKLRGSRTPYGGIDLIPRAASIRSEGTIRLEHRRWEDSCRSNRSETCGSIARFSSQTTQEWPYEVERFSWERHAGCQFAKFSKSGCLAHEERKQLFEPAPAFNAGEGGIGGDPSYSGSSAVAILNTCREFAALGR